MKDAKSFEIKKQFVFKAYKKLKRNLGKTRIEEGCLQSFKKNLEGNLYKIWNRLSSGCYQPGPKELMEMPRSSGNNKPIGLLTVEDSVAQMVVVMGMEAEMELNLYDNSYANRRSKSALQTVQRTIECTKHFPWVVDLEIKGILDNFDHKLLIGELERHVKCKWILFYIKRWLEVPCQSADGIHIQRTKGISSGWIIGPVLVNIFLHFALDEWMKRNHANIPFERYAGKTIVHCLSLRQAKFIQWMIKQRLSNYKLELNEIITKIVYCNNTHRTCQYDVIQFDFLGFTFLPRMSMDHYGKIFIKFLPAVSRTASTKIWKTIRSWNHRYWIHLTLEEIARRINPVIQGWINYYGKYGSWELKEVLKGINVKLSRWIRNKFKRFRNHKKRAMQRLGDICLSNPDLFAHWIYGVKPTASRPKRKKLAVD